LGFIVGLCGKKPANKYLSYGMAYVVTYLLGVNFRFYIPVSTQYRVFLGK
jgi:hypothetical protein